MSVCCALKRNNELEGIELFPARCCILKRDNEFEDTELFLCALHTK